MENSYTVLIHEYAKNKITEYKEIMQFKYRMKTYTVLNNSKQRQYDLEHKEEWKYSSLTNVTISKC